MNRLKNMRKSSEIDVQAAIARAHADRAKYMRAAMTHLVGAFRGHIAKSRQHTPTRAVRFGAWA